MQLDLIVLWSLGELLLISLVTASALILRGIFGRRRDRAAARSLIQNIKDSEERRSAETRDILEQHYGIAGDALDTLVKTISREEKRFYQDMINLYLKRDAGGLENLNAAFEGAVGPYRMLEVSPTEDPPAPAGRVVTDAALDDAELERLRAENERLSEELRITMDSMGCMLSEYSSMFSDDDDEALDKEKMSAMFQAEKDAGDAAAVASAVDSGEHDEAQSEAMDEARTESREPVSAEASAADDVPAGSSDAGDMPLLPEAAGARPVAAVEDEGDDELMSLDDDLEDLQTADESALEQVQV